MKRFIITALSMLFVAFGYTQTYLPLTGGTLTGHITGTTATFTGIVNPQLGISIGNGNSGTFANPAYHKLVDYGHVSGYRSGMEGFDHYSTLGTGLRFYTNAHAGGRVNAYTIDANGNNLWSGAGYFSGALNGTSATFTGEITGTTFSGLVNPQLGIFVGNGNSGTFVNPAYHKLVEYGHALTYRSGIEGFDHYNSTLGTGLRFYTNAHAGGRINTYTIDADGNNIWSGAGYFSGALTGTSATFTGNVGIGTTCPDSKLTVAGNIHSREVKVTVNAGADFVFEDSYPLEKLEKLERFIKANKHLPEIASAKEMKKDGIELGEMNIKLLQKIEELTLHLIEMDKKVTIVQNKNLELQSEVNQLKSKL